MSTPSTIPLPRTDPGFASAEDGLVILDGPNGLAVTMTADAAAQTGRNLISAADIARQQMAAKSENGDV